MTTIVVLLATMAGSVFAGYRIKTRGLATVLEDVRRFVAIQNSKDMVAYRTTRRAVLRLRHMVTSTASNWTSGINR